ncbi:AAA family ATPase [Enhygromyxa salina]|uniref:Serine/threonine-protein kinase PknB n=1 Tax=Enhygromyxa salina TaxID=215803 RepID=A0A2S9YVJ0_9BACT|nr:AAA family ATPase [Enhygromyxa salina]PRQ09118.1 Serine/threonine-protein kinase PknB [Enhygromyxa salina]
MPSSTYKIEELLYRNARTQTYRARHRDTGEKVLIRIPAASKGPISLRREHEILELLGLEPRPVHPREADLDAAMAVVTPDPGGVILKPLLGSSFDLDTMLALAKSLVTAIERAHQQRVVLRDVTPHNVLVDLSERRVSLISYGLASRVSRERSSVGAGGTTDGILAYVSPEQTGRMNREVDYRTDFYSLGVTLYELATGELPFTGSDPVELVHAHIARTPPRPRLKSAGLPRALSALILKLLAKNAEDRYRTASGILRDLERIEAQLARGADESMVLGRDDRSEQFLIPQELYGRETEFACALELFERVADGRPELLLVSGYSGIGKTALVYELHRPTVVRRGFFAVGKFDMRAQTVPYSGFVAAFRDLVLQLLTESAQTVAQYKRNFEATLGDQGQVLIELVPELELLIGNQPPVPEVDAAMAEQRLRGLLTRFVQVFTAELRPLVIFLDDLQWADAASMKLLKHLASNADSRSLLMIGAYRDNEIGPTHPLTLALADLRETEVSLTELELLALDADSVTKLVADTLHDDSERVVELTGLLRDKTGGNPFFLRQFFASLHESGELTWGAGADGMSWGWDIAALRAKGYTENVIDLMVAKLRKLADRTQRVIELAACIGSRFDATTLATVMDCPIEDVVEDLWEAVQLGLVRAEETAELNVRYRFAHDRVQEAAYSLLDEQARRRAHLRIGRLLWEGRPGEQQIEEQLFDICRHFNMCIELIEDADERRRIASLELAAGRQAKASTAYDAARSYLVAGLELAGGEQAWARGQELAFGLHRELAECEYLIGDAEAADLHFDQILEHAHAELTRVEIYKLKATLSYHSAKYPEALAATRAGLLVLGHEFPDVSDAAGLDALAAKEGATLAKLLEGHSISSFVDLPPMVDPHALAEAELYNELSLIGMFYNPQLASIGALKRVTLSIERGNSRVSGPAYGAHGMVVGSALGDYASGYAFGKVGLELSRRQGDRRAECQAAFWFAAFTNHWYAPIADGIPILKSGVEHALRIGAPIWAAYNTFFVPVHTLVSGARLDEVEDAVGRYLPLMDPLSAAGTRGYLQLVLSLTGRTPEPGTLSDANFDDASFIAQNSEPGRVLGLKHYYVAAITGLVLFGRSREAVELAEASLGSGDPAIVLFAQVVNAWWVFFQGVALCDLLSSEPANEHTEERRAAADACCERLEIYARNAPSNFEAMRLLLQAEQSRLDGDQLDAMTGYDQAIMAAREHELVHIEAFANERTGRFHLEQGREKVAKGYLREASNRYAMWGASAKVEQLRQEFPDAVADSHAQQDEGDLTSRDPRGIDLASVLKSSRVLTSEIDLQRLLQTTLTIVLENAGAERGVLLIADGDELRVEASGRLDGPRADIQTFADAPIPLEQADGLPVCVSVAQYVARTRDTMVLDDAHARGRVVQNPYIASNRVRSVICTPLVQQGRLFGVIYLENNLVAGAFTPGRIETLKLIASHSVIAIQNARLYANLNRYSQDLERINKSMSRFVPSEFLGCLGKDTLLEVGLGLSVSKDMSILFSDIRGFTSLIESLPIQQHIEFINEYLQYMEPPIATNHGFVDSYIGDAIMALFEGTSDCAVQAAVDMSAELRELNGKRAARGEAPVNMGVGINSGPLTLGTIGGPTRIKCGVIGESVNLAARVQELTKRYQTFLLVTDSSIAALADAARYTTRVVGRVTVAGSQIPTTLYEVIDAEMRLPVRDAKLATLAKYERGVAAFYAARFDEAAVEFDACLRSCPQDIPARLLRNDCDYFKRVGVPSDWTGVARLDSK